MENALDNKIVPISKETKPQETFFSMGSSETGSIEIDLVTFRQKNQESKFLVIAMKEPGTPQDQKEDISFSIDNEEAFNLLKNFFVQLTWNG